MNLMSPQFRVDDGGSIGDSATRDSTRAATPVASAEGGAIGAASMNRDSRGALGTYGGAVKSSKKAIDKSNWNKNVKVSESTVKATKDMGRGNMGKNAAYDMNVKRQRLGGLKGSPGAGDIAPRVANTEEREAVKRVYPKAYAGATKGNSVPKSSMPFGGKSVKK